MSRVEVETQNRPRNTVDVKIIIDEGQSAKIKALKLLVTTFFR